MSAPVKFPQVSVQLTGEDGNAFSIIGRVSREMRRAGLREQAEQYQRDAVQCESYDALLQLTMRTVEVS